MDWIEIVEPKSKQRMFANLRTGECSWDPPPNEPIKRTMENQWWELYDRKTQRFYYYNPTSAETVWGKPAGCDIIPLAKLQMLKENTEGSERILAASSVGSTSSHASTPATMHRQNCRNGQSRLKSCYDDFCTDLSLQLSHVQPTNGRVGRDFSPARVGHSLRGFHRGRPSSKCPSTQEVFDTSAHINSTSIIHPSPATARSMSKRRSSSPPAPRPFQGFYSHSSSQSSLGANSSELVSQATQYSIASTVTAGVDSPATGPNDRAATQRRRSEPGWSKDGLKAPLSSIEDKKLRKEALRTFKLLQQYMGDKKSKYISDYIVVSILEISRSTRELSDEFFLQLIKQLTDNPKCESLRKGWELLGIVLAFVLPVDEEVNRRLVTFVEQCSDHLLDSPELSTSQYAKHCIRRLEKRSITTTAVTLETVRQARYTIFYPSKFGASLQEQMEMQAHEFPNLVIPWIQATLMKLILEMGGEKTEGLFRIGADQDQMATAMVQLEAWVKPTVKDCHVPVNLLKQWFRKLPSPIIPNEMYNQCLASSSNYDICCQLVDSLPEINRLSLSALVLLLQRLSNEEVVRHTKMDCQNLAMLMAPNILRCESKDPATIFANSTKEMQFMLQIIRHYDAPRDMRNLIQI